jgi:hypothetical protein
MSAGETAWRGAGQSRRGAPGSGAPVSAGEVGQQQRAAQRLARGRRRDAKELVEGARGGQVMSDGRHRR